MPDEPLIRLTLAHSPDADDLVMWWPLVGLDGKTPAIDTGPFRFELIAQDVEELNKAVVAAAASPNEPRVEASGPAPDTPSRSRLVGNEHPHDITAISCAAYPAIARDYAITRCGASFGENYGPKLVVPIDSPVRTPADLLGKTIAVPGTNTTAFMALCLMMQATLSTPSPACGGGAEQSEAKGAPPPTSPVPTGEVPSKAKRRGSLFLPLERLFSHIPDAVLNAEAAAGLLIHEAQLTYADLGLRAVADMGQWWHDQTNMPLPLGLNVVRRNLDARFGGGTLRRVADLLAASVQHSVDHPEDSRRWLLDHQGDRTEWDDAELVDRYLSMYVSKMTQDMGQRGTRAITKLLTRAHKARLCADPGMIDIY